MSYLVSHRLSVCPSVSLSSPLSLSACMHMVLTLKVGGQLSTRYKMKVTYIPVPTYYVCMFIIIYIVLSPLASCFCLQLSQHSGVELCWGGVVGWMSGLVMGNSCFGVGGGLVLQLQVGSN